MKTKRFFIPLFMVLVLSSCNFLGTQELEKGTFAALVDGNDSKTLYGRAEYKLLHSFNGNLLPTYSLIDKSNSKKTDAVIQFVNIPNFKEGIYDVGSFENTDNTQLDDVILLYKDEDFEGVYLSENGTFEISHIDENSFKGSFDFSAYRLIHIEEDSYQKIETKIVGHFDFELDRE